MVYNFLCDINECRIRIVFSLNTALSVFKEHQVHYLAVVLKRVLKALTDCILISVIVDRDYRERILATLRPLSELMTKGRFEDLLEFRSFVLLLQNKVA